MMVVPKPDPITPANLNYKGSALAAFDELATVQTNVELLRTSHLMWCGRSCAKDTSCHFLHYPRSDPLAAPARAERSRYCKDTAHLYNLMGGEGYIPGISRIHEVNIWPLLEAVLERVDAARERNGLLHCDYTDWTKKKDSTAGQLTRNICRDTIQWMGNWCGADYATSIVGLHYIALTSIVDDMCIPPLDIVHGRFCMYGRSARDLVEVMVNEGWGRDAMHVLLSLVRQYLFQYVEKVDFDTGTDHIGLHAALSQFSAVWDSTVYRTYTANTYGAAVLVGRVTDSGPLTSTWLVDSAICDAISMDLAKSALRVYEQDNHIPTKAGATYQHRQAQAQAQTLERQRQIGYHSVYLDLIDDLVLSGAPDPIAHFGRSGFLFVQIQDRYLERRAGRGSRSDRLWTNSCTDCSETNRPMRI
ncbi:hypothetical protein G7Y89_g6307 [Cudoniella acicularis]|uniref:Uncharacterized protein n=1 Tax=Cudoniella acicularis TaxID=354080 RepID=A0A8H4RLJ9_9HELO|nr:hypothetical protein G7Y89_g6307 [Cudoniella acicularis]